MKTEQILEKVTVVPLYVAVVLLPSFFLPITTEWLEWNKHYLLGILMVISLLAWLGRGLVTKKLSITRSPLDWVFLAWWAAVLLSAILAKDKIAGFFGSSLNVSWGFLALTFYLLFAFLVIWNIREERGFSRFLEALGIGMGLPALYFWLHKLGFMAWLTGPATGNPASALVTHLGVLQVFLLVLALGLLLLPQLEKRRALLWGILAGLSFITIVGIGFRPIILALAVGLFVVLLFAFPRLSEVRYPVVSLAMAGFVLALIFLVLGTPRFLLTRTSAEVTLAHKSSFNITSQTLKEGVIPAVFGVGPGNFVIQFSSYRPESFNLNPFWNVRFSRPRASSYEFLTETGILGSVAAVAVFLVGLGMLWQMWRGRKQRGGSQLTVGYAQALGAVWLVGLVTMFFVAYSTTLWFVFVLGLALTALAAQLAGFLPTKEFVLSMKTSPQYALASSFIYIVVVALVVVGGIFLGRFYGADVLAARAARAATFERFEDAEGMLIRATALDPYRSRYHLRLANTFLRHASAESRVEKPDPQRIGALVSNAISASRRATELAPLSVASWGQLADMYANARVLAKEANQWVLTALGQAIALEPTNPRFYAQRGVAHRLTPEKDAEARSAFEKAIELKANYAAAHYQLSLVKEQLEDLDGAIDSAAATVQYATRDIDAKFNLARLLFNRNKENDREGAERLYRNILSQNPDHANTLYALGILLEGKKEYEEAASLYERALELDPNAELVRRRLKELPAGTPRRVRSAPVEEEEIEEEEPRTAEAAVE